MALLTAAPRPITSVPLGGSRTSLLIGATLVALGLFLGVGLMAVLLNPAGAGAPTPTVVAPTAPAADTATANPATVPAGPTQCRVADCRGVAHRGTHRRTHGGADRGGDRHAGGAGLCAGGPVSYSGPRHAGGDFHANRADQAPTIDGDLADWTGAAAGPPPLPSPTRR